MKHKTNTIQKEREELDDYATEVWNETFYENKAKKAVKAKDKRSSKKTMGTVQIYHKGKSPKHLLHMWPDRFEWIKFPHRSYVGEGRCACIFEIRPENLETSVLPLQHLLGRARSFILRKNAKGNRSRSNGKATRGSKGNSKSNRSLSQTN